MEQDLIPYTPSPVPPAHAVLVLAPHPDDEVFGCGGTLALHAQAGVRVTSIVLTGGGEHGDAAVRATESTAAARLLGTAPPDFWNLPDRGLLYSESLVQRIVERMQSDGVDLVYAPSPSEIHPDHRQTTLLALEAVRRAGGGTRLAFYEVGSPLRPNRLVDITSVAALKKRAMRCFASQQVHQDYVGHIAALNTYRTYTLPAGVAAAEAFWLVDAAEIAAGQVARSLAQVSPGLSAPADVTTQPLVSVLIRSMDRPSLAAALDSVALQTYPRIEIVVLAACADHAPLPAFWGPCAVRLLADGVPYARSAAANRALDAARGEWLMFLDDDDWLMPGHVARLADVLRRVPASRAAYTGVALIDQDDRPQGQALDLPFDATRQLAGNLMPIHAVLFESALVREGCRFDETLDRYEDWDFWLQLGRRTTPVHLPGVSACYRIHASSGVHEDAGPQGAATAAIYRKWESVWRDDEKASVMERVWAFPDMEEALLQSRTHTSQQEEAIASLHTRLENSEAIAKRAQELHAEAQRLVSQAQEVATRAQADAAQARHEAQEQRTATLNALYAVESRTAELQAVHASRSWKLTRPVRAVSDWLRSGRRAFTRNDAQPDAVDAAAHPVATAAQAALYDPGMDYGTWVAEHDTHTPESLEALRASMAGWTERPLVSVVMPVYNPPLDLLREAIASVQAQVYPHWELCLADDASPDPQVWATLQTLAAEDPRIRIVRREANGHISAASNSALELATGEFVALMDNDDLLPPDALYWVVEAVNRHPTAQILYSDEDKLDLQGTRFGAYFKPDWNHTLFMGHNMISHLGVYRTALMREVGGFRKGLEGSQDYDLALRCIERISATDILHIPRILYHWRAIPGSTAVATDAKPYAMTAAQQALEEHLLRTGMGGDIEMLPSSNYRYRPADVAACDRVTLVVLHAGPVPANAQAPAWSRAPEHGIVEVLHSAAAGDAWISAAQEAAGTLVALVHADLEPVDRESLRELSRFAARPGTGAAGGAVRDDAGRMLHGGLVLNPRTLAVSMHGGRGEDDPGYMGRAQLAQEVSALAFDCVVLRREVLDTLPPALTHRVGAWVAASLALRRAGEVLIWSPRARWRASAAYRDSLQDAWPTHDRMQADPTLQDWATANADWLERDPAYHPALDAATANFGLTRR